MCTQMLDFIYRKSARFSTLLILYSEKDYVESESRARVGQPKKKVERSRPPGTSRVIIDEAVDLADVSRAG
jgi:hypothetical protein